MTARTSKNPAAVAARRPAESAGVAGAVAVLVAKLIGLDDPDVLAATAVVVGFIPAGVTWLVDTVRGS